MLLDVLEKAREKVSQEKKTEHYNICIDHAWGLMNKYYSLTDKSRAYVVATVLDPRQKYEYFYRNWNKKFWPGMKAKMESMYDEFRIPGVEATQNLQSSP